MKAAGGEWALLSPEGTYHKLSEPNFFVGREDEMDLTLKSRSVDKQHAVISVNLENAEYKLHDLGTLNGTFVNEVRISQQPVDLKLKDNIRFGYEMLLIMITTCTSALSLVGLCYAQAVSSQSFIVNARVSCEEKILYGPKWISIEESSTLCDVLRCATGNKYLSRKLKVVVASEKSLKDLSFVKLCLPVLILDRSDKKIVSFLLKPKDVVITLNTFRVELLPQRKRQLVFDDDNNPGRQQFNGNNDHSLETVWESSYRSQPAAPERKLSIQSSAPLTNSDEDDSRAGSPHQEMHNMYHGVHSPHTQFHPYPHYPYMTPVYHHHPPVMCHCPSCTGHRSPVHSPHGGTPGNFVHHQMAPHPSWSHSSPTAFQVRSRLQRPMSVPGEKFEMIVKGSPLYGQPPWWGWGSSDDEVYNYPNTATILETDTQAGQKVVALKKKKLTKKDALEMAQRRHSISTTSVLSESKARLVATRTSKTTYESPEQKQAMKEHEEYVLFQKKSSLPYPDYGDQLSPVFENSTSRDWELPDSQSEKSSLLECDSSQENSPDDCIEGHSRPGSSYEIPFIPDYEEIPERPVSQKSDKEKLRSQEDLRKSAAGKQDGTTRKKVTSKVKKRLLSADAPTKNGKTLSASRRNSSDTSESEYEPSSHPSWRLGVVTKGTPSSVGVFGLTEVSLQREGVGGSRESLSPAPLPNWVQQWANDSNNPDNCSVYQPIEVLGSSSASEDSTHNSCIMSSSSIPVAVQRDDSESKSKLAKVASSPSLRPRAGSAKTSSVRSSGLMRTQSLSPSSLSSSPKTSFSPKISRSKTMSAATTRRSYPTATGGESDRKAVDSVRSVGLESSTSDDSDVESSDTSLTKQAKESRRKSDESDRRGVQLIPEKEGKRPLSAPRPNKTAMLRAHNSREAVKNSGNKTKTPPTAKSRTAKNSPPNSAGSGNSAVANQIGVSPAASRVWSPSVRRSTKSSSGDETLDVAETGVKCDEVDVTQKAVDDVFTSGPVLPESLQMKRDDPVNKTFVLDEGKGDSPITSPEESSMPDWVNKVSDSKTITESKDALDENTASTTASGTEPEEKKLESAKTQGVSLQSKLIPFAPFIESPPYTPPVADHPFEPPVDSVDDLSGGSRSSTGEGRSMSPDSVVSAALPSSPSPPLTPSSAAKAMFDFKGGAASSQSRRQWGVTDKPVEDLMLSSIHAFSVELRLASESVLSKVKTLYDGSEEELNGTARSRNSSDSKQESQSAIPDWKSSHAEIAGIFRNLRKVELRLRTMEQALSIMCVASQKEPKKSFQEQKISMIETSSLGLGQKWREFKIKARRNSWAVEHRNQFPVPPAESDEEDEDTS